MSNENEPDSAARIPEFSRPQVLSLLGFEEGELFTSDHYAEHLQCTTALDALEEMLEHNEHGTWLKGAGDIRAFLRENPTWVDIDAYRRDEISKNQLESWGERLTEVLREWFGEEYGNFDDGDDGLLYDTVREMERKATELATWYVSKARVYNCTKVRSWRLDSADLLEIVEQLRPEWLDVNWVTEMARDEA